MIQQIRKELREKAKRTDLPEKFLIRLGVELILEIPDDKLIDQIEVLYAMPKV